jgi:alpha-D-ribose 1-methylphosphonate 5-triphosphate synthase subunit PhnG
MSPIVDTNPITERGVDRHNLMLACAHASVGELRSAIDACGSTTEAADVRRPEVGLVMLRGRVGGDGAPFNLGEATVTRATVRLATGEIGHGYVLGRNPEKARLAALADALGQRRSVRNILQESLVATVMARLDRERTERAALTAATKVNFFTLARGDD